MTGANEQHERLPEALVDELKRLDRAPEVITSRVDRSLAGMAHARFAQRRISRWQPQRAWRVAAAACVLVVVLFTTNQLWEPDDTSIYADIDGSGQVDIADVLALARAAGENETRGQSKITPDRALGHDSDDFTLTPFVAVSQADIAGHISTVRVKQQFANPFDTRIEAVYVFPLPEKAAVSEFLMVIGERTIRGILREQEEAEAIYRQARDLGYQASLLVQHRPNIFEQKVANIEPGKAIDVDITYFNTLAYRDGWYSFVFPTVVGPRFNPPGHPDPVQARPRGGHTTTPGAAGVEYLGLNDSAEAVMDAFLTRVSRAALTDVEIDWGGMTVSATYPDRLPDLFVGRPLVVAGKFRGDPASVTVSGTADGTRRTFVVEAADAGHAGPSLAKVWARAYAPPRWQQLTPTRTGTEFNSVPL